MTDYFIDYNTGSDSDTGTSPLSPWKTFSNLLALTIYAGDRIMLKRGSTWPAGTDPNCRLVLLGKGSSKTTPFIIRPYGDTGAAPCIDGENLATSALSDLPCLISEGAAGTCYCFWMDDIEIKRTLNAPYGTGLYLYFTTDHPAYYLSNLYIHHHGYDGMLLHPSSSGATNTRDRRVWGCRIDTTGNDGFSNGGTANGVYFIGNTASNIAQIANGSNYGAIDYTSGDGFTAHGTGCGHKWISNKAYLCVDALNVVNYGTSTTNVIERNWFYNCLEKLIWVVNDPGANFTTPTLWSIRNNVLCMEATMADSSIARGVTYGGSGSTVAGLMLGYPSGDFNQTIGTNITELVHNAAIYNNLVYNRHASAYAYWLNATTATSAMSTVNFRNNIAACTGNGGALKILGTDSMGASGVNLTCNYNHFPTNATARWSRGVAQVATPKDTLVDWQGIGTPSTDANSAGGDVLLVGDPSATIDEARLAAGSPAIGLATNLYGTFQDDWEGRLRPAAGAWDAGAFHRYAGGSTPIVKGGRLLGGVGL